MGHSEPVDELRWRLEKTTRGSNFAAIDVYRDTLPSQASSLRPTVYLSA